MSESLRQTIDSAQKSWVGCCWETAFGSRKLNLCGLSSRQALRAARALRGDEAICWRNAAVWLQRIEEDAARASELAEQSWSQASAGHFAEARALLSLAATLQAQHSVAARYRECLGVLERLTREQSSNVGGSSRFVSR